MLIQRVQANIRSILKKFLKEYSHLKLDYGKKHIKVVNTNTGDFVPIQHSCTEHHSIKNLVRDINLLAVSGRGVISHKLQKIYPVGASEDSSKKTIQ